MHNKMFKKEGDPDIDLLSFIWYPDYTQITCTIKAFLSDGQGKFALDQFVELVIMGNLQSWIPDLFRDSYFERSHLITDGFRDYITNTPKISEQYVNILIGTLPGQRYEFYEDSDFGKVKSNVVTELNKIDDALGFYNIRSKTDLLQNLEPYSYAILFIGLIFNILLIIFVVVAILLIYSLLMISVETKT